MSDKTYEDGVREGRLVLLEITAEGTKDRLDSHARRLRLLERIVWGFFGIMVFLQFMPIVQSLLGVR